MPVIIKEIPKIGARNSNKLRAVTDAVTGTLSHGFSDIQDGQVHDAGTPSNNNYQYDEIGNLIEDKQEEIDEISWTVYGKVKEVKRASGSNKPDLEFHYDGNGNRIMKIVKNRDGTSPSNEDKWVYTFYVRDASGNILSTYETKFDDQVTAPDYKEIYTQKEVNLFGSMPWHRGGLVRSNLEALHPASLFRGKAHWSQPA